MQNACPVLAEAKRLYVCVLLAVMPQNTHTTLQDKRV